MPGPIDRSSSMGWIQARCWLVWGSSFKCRVPQVRPFGPGIPNRPLTRCHPDRLPSVVIPAERSKWRDLHPSTVKQHPKPEGYGLQPVHQPHKEEKGASAPEAETLATFAAPRASSPAPHPAALEPLRDSRPADASARPRAPILPLPAEPRHSSHPAPSAKR